MALQAKYQSLLNLANSLGVSDLSVKEQGNVLHVNGTVSTDDAKQKLWDAYNIIDPDMRAGDLVLNIEVVGGAGVFYVVQKGDSLSKIAKNYPNTTWKEIFEANKDQIKNPDLIQIGQKLRIPG